MTVLLNQHNAQKDLPRQVQTSQSTSDPQSPPMRAAQGDDDLMSQPQRKQPSTDLHAGQWPQRVPDAAATWVRLTDAELLESAGALDPLADLVQARYAVSRDEALDQVRAFFDRY